MMTSAPTRRGRRGGRLQTGNPGNRGGPGRPPRTARAEAFAEIDRRLPWLNRVASRCLTRDGMRAMDMLVKVATIDTLERSDVNLVLEQTVHVIRAKLPTAQADDLLAALARYWRAL